MPILLAHTLVVFVICTCFVEVLKLSSLLKSFPYLTHLLPFLICVYMRGSISCSFVSFAILTPVSFLVKILFWGSCSIHCLCCPSSYPCFIASLILVIMSNSWHGGPSHVQKTPGSLLIFFSFLLPLLLLQPWGTLEGCRAQSHNECDPMAAELIELMF